MLRKILVLILFSAASAHADQILKCTDLMTHSELPYDLAILDFPAQAFVEMDEDPTTRIPLTPVPSENEDFVTYALDPLTKTNFGVSNASIQRDPAWAMLTDANGDVVAECRESLPQKPKVNSFRYR